MGIGLLNLGMLFGLAGLSVPLIIHLLSRRRFQILPWAAMQFLLVSETRRRRIRLEDLLLLLLRLGIVALFVFALCRPYAEGGWLGRWANTQERDIVFIIDGSISMDLQGHPPVPHQAARDWAAEFLDELRPGDAVGVLQAHEEPQSLVWPLTHDHARVREALAKMPTPAGAADIPAAISLAIQGLSRGEHVERDVVVLTDGQSHGWRLNAPAVWELLGDLAQHTNPPPRIWVVDVTRSEEARPWTNWSVNAMPLARHYSVVGVPLRIEAEIRYEGKDAAAERPIWLERDGVEIAGTRQQIQALAPGTATRVEFEYTPTDESTAAIAVTLPPDDLPGDNRWPAVLAGVGPLRILLVDGDPSSEPWRGEGDFLRAVLAPPALETPYVRLETRTAAAVAAADFAACDVAILANNVEVPDALDRAVADLLARGGGVWVAPGDRTDRERLNARAVAETGGWLPATLTAVERPADRERGESLATDSMRHPVLAPLSGEGEGTVSAGRIDRFWRLEPKSGSEVLAELKGGAPFAVAGRSGAGRVVVWSVPVDADWGTLPAQSDFVPLVYETLFYLAGSAAESLNLRAGWPFEERLRERSDGAWAVLRPDGRPDSTDAVWDGRFTRLRYDRTGRAGVYHLAHSGEDRAAVPRTARFAVAWDPRESVSAPLEQTARERLSKSLPLAFHRTREEVALAMFEQNPRHEMWRWLAWALLALLLGELLLTRSQTRPATTGT